MFNELASNSVFVCVMMCFVKAALFLQEGNVRVRLSEKVGTATGIFAALLRAHRA